jgi:hypothetical protein
MLIETEIEIEASVESVWALLIDFEGYEKWNPLTVNIEGKPIVGEVVKLHVKLADTSMIRKHVISRVESNTALCWTIRTRRPWLMRGERCQTLEDLGSHRCMYRNSERVEGLTSVIVAWFYKKKIRQGIESVGLTLKQLAETT